MLIELFEILTLIGHVHLDINNGGVGQIDPPQAYPGFQVPQQG